MHNFCDDDVKYGYLGDNVVCTNDDCRWVGNIAQTVAKIKIGDDGRKYFAHGEFCPDCGSPVDKKPFK